MSTTIQVKRSAVQGKVPLTTDIELGEIAINTYDGKLFIKKNVGGTESVVDVGGGGLSAGDLLTEIKTVDGSGSGLDADLLDGLESTDFARVNTLGGNSDDYLSVTRNSTDPTLYVNQISSGDIARFFKGTDAANTSSDTQVTITNSGGITATGSVSASGISVFTSTDVYSPAIRLDSQTASGSWSRLDFRNTALAPGNEFIIYQANTGTAGIRNLSLDTPITFTVNDGGTPTEVMRIEGSTSRVGILTSTPSQPLHVVGAIKTTAGLLFGSTESYLYENAANSVALRVGSDGPFVTITDSGSNLVNIFNVSGAIALGTENSEKARITNAGYVLIGRTSATLGGGAGYNLQIGSGSDSSGMTFHAGTTSLSDIQFADGISGDESYRGLIRYGHNGDYMTLWTAASEKLRINSSGDVGIGTATPAEKLDVNGVALTKSTQEAYTVLTGTTPTVDADVSGAFALTTSGDTTFTFSGVTSNRSVGFILKVTAGGTHTLTWPAAVNWPDGTAPTAPASGETDLLTFFTFDGGTTWYGAQSINAAA